MKDKNGLTEKEFLLAYNPDKYKKPSVTADVLIFAEESSILLVKRSNHPCIGMWALPGGFSNEGESLEDAARRELFEETGVECGEMYPIGVFSAPGRDARGWVISSAYAAYVGDKIPFRAGDDAAQCAWFSASVERDEGEFYLLVLTHGEEKSVTRFTVSEEASAFGLVRRVTQCAPSGIAFDHAEMIAAAIIAKKHGKIL